MSCLANIFLSLQLKYSLKAVVTWPTLCHIFNCPGSHFADINNVHSLQERNKKLLTIYFMSNYLVEVEVEG